MGDGGRDAALAPEGADAGGDAVAPHLAGPATGVVGGANAGGQDRGNDTFFFRPSGVLRPG